MAFEDLSPEQAAFIDAHVLPGFSAQVAATRKAAYDAARKAAADEIAKLPAAEPKAVALAGRLTEADGLYAGDYATALETVREARIDAEALRVELQEAKTEILDAFDPLKTDPAGASDDEIEALRKLHETVTDAVGGDGLATHAQIATAAAALKTLARKIAVIEKVKLPAEDRAQIEGLLDTSPETAEMLLDKLEEFEATDGELAADTASVQTQKAAVTTARTKLAEAQAALEAVEGKTEADFDSPEAFETAKKEAADLVAERQAALEAAEQTLEGMKFKKEFLDLVLRGDLAEGSPLGFDDDTRADLLETMWLKPSFARVAIEALRLAPDRDGRLEDFELIDGLADGDFEHGGEYYADTEWYAEQLMYNITSLGSGERAALEAYVQSGAHFVEKPFGDDPGYETRLESRTAAMVDALEIDPVTGAVTVGAAAEALAAHLKFSPDVLEFPMPELAKHVSRALEELKRPEVAAKLAAVTAPADDAAKDLVRQTLGLAADAAVGEDEARKAALMAFLTPVDQGDVGSCFTTAPARRFRDQKPEEMLERLVSMVSTGEFEAPSGRKVPVVTKLNAGDGNPLVRSFEYSAAAVAATEDNSRERQALAAMMFQADGLDKVADIVGATDWTAVELLLSTHLRQAFRITYDPTIETEKAADGSSSQGRFVLVINKAFAGAVDSRITTKDLYIAAMQKIGAHTLSEFGYDPGKDEDKPKFQKMKELIDSDAFQDCIGGGKRKPWEMASGGMERGPTDAMFGGSATTVTALAKGTRPAATATPEQKAAAEGRRSADVLSSLAGLLEGSGAEMVNIGTDGIHAFSALPQEPAFRSLMDPDPATRAANIDAALGAPGRDIAGKDIPKDRAIHLYETRLIPYLDDADDTLRPLLQTAIDANRPTGDMTPKALQAAIDAAIQVESDHRAAKAAEDWRKERIAAGETPSTDDFDKKLAEKKKDYKKAFENANLADLAQKLAVPYVKFADTNWGDADNHVYFAMAPDPRNGELRLWKVTEPGGKMSPMDDDWVYTAWDKTE